MIKICSVVIGNTLQEFLKNLKQVQKVSNFIELRVDYIRNLTIKDIEIIKKATYRDNIFTCRSIKEGGNFKGTKKKLIEIIEKANQLKFNHIDIEISMLKHINFNKKYSKIIGSYHNFQETPDYKKLQSIYKKIISYNFVDVAKIATMVKNDEDNINLSKLLINKQTEMIVLGMGEKGKITRIITPFLGGYLTFASIGNNKSASGQYSLNELKTILGEKNVR